MAALAIQKISREGIGYSTVDLNDVRHVFVAAAPRCAGTLRQQADDALGVIAEATRRQGADGAIVHQAVFLADIEQAEECRRIIREFYGSDLPATSYIPQPPCDGKLLAIECLGVGSQCGEVEIDREGEQLVVVRHNGIAWAHCAPAVLPNRGLSQFAFDENGTVPFGSASGAYDGAIRGFEQLRSLLEGVNMRFSQVIRTWLYCGAIGESDGSAPRYQELNRARRDFYQNIPFLGDFPNFRTGFLGDCPNFRISENGTVPFRSANRGPVYPASTCIGAGGRGVGVGAIALATDREDIVAVPLENPRQTSAFGYSSEYGPVSPMFCRALALSCGNFATIFISGTASITGEDTRHAGDAVAQTHETLDNIAALISEENLARHGLPGLGASLDSLGTARVYLKRPEDYAEVRAVCENRLGELPTIYATADVCRPDLLVEIEGIAFSRKDE